MFRTYKDPTRPDSNGQVPDSIRAHEDYERQVNQGPSSLSDDSRMDDSVDHRISNGHPTGAILGLSTPDVRYGSHKSRVRGEFGSTQYTESKTVLVPTHMIERALANVADGE